MIGIYVENYFLHRIHLKKYLFYRISYIAVVGGFWVYPVFQVLSVPARTLFLAFCILPPLGFYLLGEKMHQHIWGQQSKKITFVF